MGVLMPLALVIAVTLLQRPRRDHSWMAVGTGMGLFVLPVAAWIAARSQVDGAAFFRPLFLYDFVARTIRPIEEHAGGFLYYADVLQRHQYDWLCVGAVAWWLRPTRWTGLKRAASSWNTDLGGTVLTAWALIAFLIPTLMRTKVPWYLNTFYPVFAAGLALWLAGLFRSDTAATIPRWRRVALATSFGVVLVVAESRLICYSFVHRDMRRSEQALMLDARHELRGARVFLQPAARADHFIAEAIVGARPVHVVDHREFVSASRPGDYILSSEPCARFGMETVRSNGADFLCLRNDD
jgi:hypothetical protein